MSTIPFHSSIYVRISLTTGIKILKFVIEYLKGGGGGGITDQKPKKAQAEQVRHIYDARIY